MVGLSVSAKSALWAICLFLAVPLSAWAQTNPSPRFNNVTIDGTITGGKVTATGGTTGRAQADRAADVINVKDFGALGNDVADDTAAINAALSSLRSAAHNIGPTTNGEITPYKGKVVFPYGTYKITGPLNLTGFVSLGIEIDFDGAAIDCQTPAGVCVDMMGSRYMVVRNMRVWASGATPPKIGVQYGRIANGVSADQITFENPSFAGPFSVADMLNVASEDTTITHMQAWNNAPSGAYTLILDGINHWNVTSTFATITLPVDTAQSFIDFHCIDCLLRAGGGGNVLWVSNASTVAFDHGYIALSSPTAGAAYGVVLYSLGSGQAVTQADFDVHFETTEITDTFFFTGTNATPVINGFRYRDISNQASNSVFKTDATSIVLRDADIRIAAYAATANLFDQPTKWGVTGSYQSAVLTQFNAPTAWRGVISTDQRRQMAYYGSATNFSLQMPDSAVTGGNNRGNAAVDMQTNRVAATQVASGNSSVVAGGFANEASGAQSIVAGSSNRAAATSTTVFGQANTALANFSTIPGGNGAADRSRGGVLCYSSSLIATAGDNQFCINTLQQTTALAAAVRLTVGGGAASSSNCINAPNNGMYSVIVTLTAFDVTTPTKNYTATWGGGSIAPHLLTRGANAASTLFDGVTSNVSPDATRSNGTLTGIASTIAADTTNGCLNVQFTPPTGNTDTWHIGARVDTMENQ
jgi:hypothetical protein